MNVRTGFFALVVIVLGAIGYLIVEPFLQFVLGAALLAFVLYPLQRRLEPRIGTRPSAIVLTAFAFVVAIVPIILFSVVILSTALEYVERIGDGDVELALDTFRTYLADDLGLPSDWIDEVESTVVSGMENIGYSASEVVLSEMVSVINATIHTSFGLMVLAFLLYYFLADGDEFVGWVRHVAPLESDVANELEEEISTVSWAVIYSHLLVAIVEGILGGIGLYIVGVPNVAFWTVVMIVVSILPVIGVWLVWFPAVLYLFVTGDVIGGIFLLAYGIAVLSVVDNYLRAIFVDRGSGLHPATVLVGVLGGIYLLGVLGLFLGPVLLAVFKASLTVFARNWNDVGDRPPPSSESQDVG